MIHRLFDPLMAESAGRGAALDWKTSLQELTAALGLGVPDYVIDDTGPDHAKTFTAWVVVAGERYGGSDGRSKKEAEQRAAAAAWRTLSERADGGVPQPAAVGGGSATADRSRAGGRRPVSLAPEAGTATPGAGAARPGGGGGRRRPGRGSGTSPADGVGSPSRSASCP